MNDARIYRIGRQAAVALALIGFLAFIGPALTAAPVDPTLVLHYKFDKNSRAAVKDLSGHGNDGKIIDGQWLAEVDGRKGVLRLNGRSSYIDCGSGDRVRVDGDTTIEMWVRLNRPLKETRWGGLFDASSSFQFTSAYFGSELLAYYRNRDDRREMMVEPIPRHILGDQWAHLAVVVAYPRMKFYCDGKLVRDGYMPFPGLNGQLQTGPTRIGGNGKTSFSPIDLTEFRLYRRALTQAEIAADAKGQPVVASADRQLRITPDWYRKAIAVRLTTHSANDADQAVEISLGDQAAQQVKLADASMNASGRYVAVATFPLTQDMKGRTVKATARLTGSGVQLDQAVKLEKPDWIHTKAGYSDKVLAPWTPVQAKSAKDGVQVGIWGRRYDFGPTPFLSRIETKQQEILAAPIRLDGLIDGRSIDWKGGQTALKAAAPTAAVVEQSYKADGATLTIAARTEYDGYTIYDCRITAGRDLKLDELKLDIPLKTQFATLCYGDRVLPLKKGAPLISQWYSGAVKGSLSFMFSPNIWLGNEDLGLTWQTESDQYWHNADPNRAIQILPDGQTTLFRAHFVDKPTQLKTGQSLHYKFALLATPIKPLVHDAWWWRIARSEPYGADLNLPDRRRGDEPTLAYYHRIGIRHLFTNVNDIWPWPMPVHPTFIAAQHRLVEAAHQQGIKVYPYVIHQRFPVTVPEFDPYGLNMANRPLRQFVPGSNPDEARPGPVTTAYGADSQGTVFMCDKSQALQDAYIHALAQRLEQFGDDGVYLDGTCQIGPLCENMDHGCGYKGADGKIHGTYPTFAVRDMMKRIYTVVKERNPDNIVDVHCSWGWNPAGLAYGDVLWTGEQWHQYAKTGVPGGYVSGALSLDQFRTEFMGYQLGVGAEMLTYRLGGNNMKCAAISLLHDISPRLSTNRYSHASQSSDDPYFALVPAIWKMREQFDAEHAKKLFYWNNQSYVNVAPQQCYATLLQNPKTGVLAIISNLARKKQDVTVRFDLDKLGLAGQRLKVFNPLNGQAVEMTPKGQLSLPLDSEAWVYVWLQPQ